jgi:HEPN domain-containing protein
MEKDELIKYWIESSELDFRAMNNLYSTKDFVWALFLGHLVIEKLLKALTIKNNLESIPRIHDLNKIAKATGIEVDESLKDSFDIISSFNIEARYPDYKKEFYKKCNNEFTTEQTLKIKAIRLLLLKQLQK